MHSENPDKQSHQEKSCMILLFYKVYKYNTFYVLYI